MPSEMCITSSQRKVITVRKERRHWPDQINSSIISGCEGGLHVLSGMAPVSCSGARITCFVETLRRCENADLRLLVLRCCRNMFFTISRMC